MIKISNFFIILILKILLILSLLFHIKLNNPNELIKIIISIESLNQPQKYWVGETYKISLTKFPLNNLEKVYSTSINNKTQIINNDFLLMKSCGRECIIAFTKKINSTICFFIYNAPKIKFNEINPIKIESNDTKQLNYITMIIQM